MKKNAVLILSIILVFSILLNIFYLVNENCIIQIKEGKLSKYYNMQMNEPQKEYVKDAKTAVKIAKAIIGIKYGLYTVDYDKDNEVWVVAFSSISLLPKNGYIYIQKSDGKIKGVYIKKM